MRKKSIQEGITHLDISSAGIYQMNGHPADPKAVKILEKHGFDVSEHHSKVINKDMLKRSDLIPVMENVHSQIILEDLPGVAAKVHLLKSFSGDFNGTAEDIKDPYRLSDYYYRLCFAEITTSVNGLIKYIKK